MCFIQIVTRYMRHASGNVTMATDQQDMMDEKDAEAWMKDRVMLIKNMVYKQAVEFFAKATMVNYYITINIYCVCNCNV